MNWFKSSFSRKLYFIPTDNEVYNACLTYRHDYGLLSAEQKKQN